MIETSHWSHSTENSRFVGGRSPGKKSYLARFSRYYVHNEMCREVGDLHYEPLYTFPLKGLGLKFLTLVPDIYVRVVGGFTSLYALRFINYA